MKAKGGKSRRKVIVGSAGGSGKPEVMLESDSGKCRWEWKAGSNAGK